jgi:hypothetical protein
MRRCIALGPHGHDLAGAARGQAKGVSNDTAAATRSRRHCLALSLHGDDLAATNLGEARQVQTQTST